MLLELLSLLLQQVTHLPLRNTLVIGHLPACILCSLLPSGQHYWSLVVLTAVFGFIISSGPTVSTPLIVDLLGIQHLNTAFGISQTLVHLLLKCKFRYLDICPWDGCSNWTICSWIYSGQFFFKLFPAFLYCIWPVWCLCLLSLFDLVPL